MPRLWSTGEHRDDEVTKIRSATTPPVKIIDTEKGVGEHRVDEIAKTQSVNQPVATPPVRGVGEHQDPVRGEGENQDHEVASQPVATPQVRGVGEHRDPVRGEGEHQDYEVVTQPAATTLPVRGENDEVTKTQPITSDEVVTASTTPGLVISSSVFCVF